MNINEYDVCPVCKRNFEADDDIVVCPDCGTPHHRECYKSLGHCANVQKHNDNYTYESVPQQGSEAPSEVQKDIVIKCPACSCVISKDDPYCRHCGAKLAPADVAQLLPPAYGTDGEEIDGIPVSDIAAVVKTNAPRFIIKYRKMKKVSWNWGAFVFGPYYLLFRKIYDMGIITAAISLISSLVINGVFFNELKAFTKLINGNKDYLALYSMKGINYDVLMKLSQEPAYKAIIPAATALILVTVAIHLFCALFADSIYKKKISRIVSKVNEKLEQGDTITEQAVVMEHGNLSQKQIKALILSRKGGTSIISPIICYLVIDMITSYISKL